MKDFKRIIIRKQKLENDKKRMEFATEVCRLMNKDWERKNEKLTKNLKK